MKKDCENCQHRITEYDVRRKRMIRRCSEYPNLTVFGFVTGLINPECSQYLPIQRSKLDGKSLAENTYIMAGGKYIRETEKERSGLTDLTPWRPLKRR